MMTMKELNVTINFDMDGTIADLYANPNWLPLLRACDPTPYATAKPLLRLATLEDGSTHCRKTATALRSSAGSARKARLIMTEP